MNFKNKLLRVIDESFSQCCGSFPFVFMDIGASGGIPDKWRFLKKYVRVIAFEPDEDAYNKLVLGQNKEVNIRYLKAALDKEIGEAQFNITRKQECSSLLKPNTYCLKQFPDSNRFDILRTKTISTTTIDEVVMKHNINYVDLIKIDTQGSELFILNGCEDLLKNSIFAVEIEVEFTPLYEDQPLFSDVDDFMRKNGFLLFDIKRYYWKRKDNALKYASKGQLVFGDALYLRGAEFFFANLKDKSSEQSRAEIIKAIIICIMYGYLDYALHICLLSFESNLLNDNDVNIARKSLLSMKNFGGTIPNFKGRLKIAKLVYSLYLLLKPNVWYSVDTDLGNNFDSFFDKLRGKLFKL